MATYNLSQTAAEIDSAIGKVHNADTTPTQGSTNMVTSDGVFDAVNSIGISALPIITEAQGIANYDNDNNIPTNAAVKDYVDSSAQDFAIFSVSDNTGTSVTSSRYINIDGTVVSASFASLSGGALTLNSGTYEFGLCGNFYENDGDDFDYWDVQLRVNELGGGILGSFTVNETSSYKAHSTSGFYFKNSAFTVHVYAQITSTPVALRWDSIRLFVRKLT